MPDVFIIGGANGAGKTTAAKTLLSHYLSGVSDFINADEIAQELKAKDFPAAREMIRRVEALIQAKKNFAFESTCAGHQHRILEKCRQAGYRLNLIFLWLPTVEMAILRVAHRVQQGGHFIPEDVIRRRYVKGLKNLIVIYLPLVDRAVIMDNSLLDKATSFIIVDKAGSDLTIVNSDAWQKILNTTKES